MQDKSDAKLLRDYAEHGNEAALRELVTRHTDFVYSAALRQVHSPDQACDIAQSVFTDLVRKTHPLAEKLPEDGSLAGWFHRATRYAALSHLRDTRRRLANERQAMEQLLTNSESAPDWGRVRPVLDEALDSLGDEDREALLLRFFKNHDFRAVGLALGVSDDAAQKRVSRALERLRAEFNRRGVTTTTVALSTAVSANAVSVAPAGLATTLSTAALTGTTFATIATATATKAIVMTTLQKTLITVTIVAAVGTGIYEVRQASKQRAQNQTLQQQHVEQIEQLTRERDDATNLLASMSSQAAQLKSDSAELLKLRGEVTRLRAESQELAKLKSEDSKKAANNPEIQALIDRVRLIRQRLEQTPGAKIPELQSLGEEDWLMAANHKLDNDDDYRLAFSSLRDSGEEHFLRSMETPLRKYIEANNSQFPNDLAQLKPYFEKPPGDDVLQRYHIVPGNSVPGANILGDREADWLITLKSLVDPEHDGHWALGRNVFSTFTESEEMEILAPAMKAMADATPEVDGKKSMDMHQLAPYLTTPRQKAAYQKLMQKGNSGSK